MPDAAERADACIRADRLIHAQAPWVYLYFPTSFHIIAAREWVSTPVDLPRQRLARRQRRQQRASQLMHRTG
jgi:hypothetical protein